MLYQWRTNMKYINVNRLKAHIQYLIRKDNYELFDVLELLSFIDALQQEQPIKVNTLTWKDINDLERIINNVHYEFRNGIGEKSFGEEVLDRFMEERDEQEQPEVDLDSKVTFDCISKKVTMSIRELINYYIDRECCDVAEECGF